MGSGKTQSPPANPLRLAHQCNTSYIKISIELCLFKSFGKIRCPFDETVLPRLDVFHKMRSFLSRSPRLRQNCCEPKHHLLSNILAILYRKSGFKSKVSGQNRAFERKFPAHFVKICCGFYTFCGFSGILFKPCGNNKKQGLPRLCAKRCSPCPDQCIYLAYSTARLSRITFTLIWPG